VKIGANVWIGENAVILAGASVGDGCIVGANAVVTKAIPANCMVVGSNRVIKRYSDELKQWVSVK